MRRKDLGARKPIHVEWPINKGGRKHPQTLLRLTKEMKLQTESFQKTHPKANQKKDLRSKMVKRPTAKETASLQTQESTELDISEIFVTEKRNGLEPLKKEIG